MCHIFTIAKPLKRGNEKFDSTSGLRPERRRAAVHDVGAEKQGERQQNQGSRRFAFSIKSCSKS